MKKDTFYAAQVVSMSSTTFIGDMGWIYIAESRGGCYAMWVHYYLNVTIPTIQRSNDLHLNKVSSI